MTSLAPHSASDSASTLEEPKAERLTGVDKLLVSSLLVLVAAGFAGIASISATDEHGDLLRSYSLLLLSCAAAAWLVSRVPLAALTQARPWLYPVALLFCWAHALVGRLPWVPLAIVLLTTNEAVLAGSSRMRSARAESLWFTARITLAALVLVQLRISPYWLATLLLSALVVRFLSGRRLALPLVVIGTGTLLAPLYVWLRAPYVRDRMLGFVQPEADPLGAGFQASQSLIAIGSGGLTGVGFRSGTARFAFLPEIESAMFFSHLAEEFGLLGSLAVFTLVGIVVTRGAVSARDVRPPFDLLGPALATFLLARFALHVATATVLIPTWSISLPLVSYSPAVVSDWLVVGLLLALSRSTARYRPVLPVLAGLLRAAAKRLRRGRDAVRATIAKVRLRRLAWWLEVLVALFTAILMIVQLVEWLSG